MTPDLREVLAAAFDGVISNTPGPDYWAADKVLEVLSTVGYIPVKTRPHDGYAQPLDGGFRGYQARCWDCGWAGTEFLRGDEPWGSVESREHKNKARREAWEHSESNQIPCCSHCNRAVEDDA